MFRNLKKNTKKDFNWKKRSIFISGSISNFEKKFTYPGSSQRVEPIVRISKNLGVH